MREAARRHEIFVSIGFNEGTRASVGCLWNSFALIGDDGELLNHHRKLVPTYLREADLVQRRWRRTARRRYPIGRLGHADLRREHQPAGALCADGARRADSYFKLSAALADHGRPPAAEMISKTAIADPAPAAHSFEAKVFIVVRRPASTARCAKF